MKKILLVVAITLFCCVTTTTQAQQVELSVVDLPSIPAFDIDKELQFWLEKDKKAPYEGILLNPDAVALILSEHDAQRQRAEATLIKQRDQDQSVLDLDVGKLRVELDATNSKSDINRKAAAADVERLKKINEDLRKDSSGFWNNVLYFGCGAGVGVLAGFLVAVGS